MATIGSFKKSENGDHAGAVKTLTLCVSACNFDPLSWGIGVQN